MSKRTPRTEYSRELRHRIASEVIQHYGGRCACCGTTDDLSIDHPNGDGGEHRKELFSYHSSSFHFYLWLKRNGYPSGYNVLCRTCNSSKSQNTRCPIAHDQPGFKWCSHPLHTGYEPLPLEDFHRNPMTKDGRRSYCKSCMKQFVMPRYPNRGRRRAK